jgi:hypothetical protein
LSQNEEQVKGRKAGGAENKRAAGPAENKSAETPSANSLDNPKYAERLREGRHFDPSLPGPFGNQLPDLGFPVKEEPAV